jgi:hypothetical protein
MLTYENFVGQFNDTLSQEECQGIIDYFEELNKLNLTSDRMVSENVQKHVKNDSTAFLLQPQVLSLHKTNLLLQGFLTVFWHCYNLYASEFSILGESESHTIKSIRLQKTLPGGGYHNWHFEASTSLTSNRVLAWILYLNDVEEGGETEFLYLRKRISPKAGTLIMWPAGFTHAHRGNPPLVSEKYILTGWVEFLGNS